VLDADILRISTPVWLGHPSWVTQRVLDRLGTELIRRGWCTQDRRRCFPRVQRRRVQHPGAGCTNWNGAATESTDYNELDEVPEEVESATAAAARNAAHLARVLHNRTTPYE
jgi:hypothetical protein